MKEQAAFLDFFDNFSLSLKVSEAKNLVFQLHFSFQMSEVIVRPWLMSQKIFLLTFKGICMHSLLELNFFILSHPVTSKQPRKVVQIHMPHSVAMHL